ncbi:dolichyl-phosphate beta-glucosyltransferase [uncultured Methanoregula sp.]|uniref:dolichyl-phosphate beta-glucosyltransferase n=1 Tax=uncultured Methanoregula sp. TaxID=1005933 RepID=UPI002AAC3652|nr:dolichyl-phosphate beta-glucosyltransferase [uncultured Methanoregula sp.]
MTASPEEHYSLIIPAYNEEKRITQLFDAISGFDGELIVVCDGTDRTADVVGTITARRSDLNIRCLRFQERLGKGGGVLAGLAASRAPRVGYFDADGSTSVGEMLRLFAMLDSSDAAIGSRWVPGSNLVVRQGFLRRIESRVFNLLIRLLFGLSFHDTQCGAKVFRRQAIETLLPRMVSRGFEFDVELLWRIRKAGCTITEVPIEWQNKGDSRVQKRDMIRMLLGLFAIRFGPDRQ